MIGDQVGPMSWEEFQDTPNDALIAEINFQRGAVYGYELRIKELEEKFALALEYQRETDARLVEQYTRSVDINYGDNYGDGRYVRPIVITESWDKSIPELIRGEPLDH